MEERLFFIGCAMGAYAWASRRWEKKGALNTALKTGFWHGLFCALAAFSITLVVVMSMDTRARFLPAAAEAFGPAELLPSLAVAAAAGLLGFWRGWTGGREPSKRRYFLSEDTEWAETVFSAVLLAAVLMYFVVQAFKIPSGSMRMTLLEGDHLFVNKFIYGLRVPFSGRRVLPLQPVSRGDIVVFRFPSDEPRALHCGSLQYNKDFIKRVIGLPGDAVELRAGQLVVNGQPRLDEPYAQWVDGAQRQPEAVAAARLSREEYQRLWQGHRLDHELQDVQRDHFGPVTVPPGSYFVMGDNRDRSCDGRYWGPVETKYLKGKAWFIYWPPSRMRIVR